MFFKKWLRSPFYWRIVLLHCVCVCFFFFFVCGGLSSEFNHVIYCDDEDDDDDNDDDYEENDNGNDTNNVNN